MKMKNKKIDSIQCHPIKWMIYVVLDLVSPIDVSSLMGLLTPETDTFIGKPECK